MSEFDVSALEAQWEKRPEYETPQRHSEVLAALQVFAECTGRARAGHGDHDKPQKAVAPELWRTVQGWLCHALPNDPWTALWAINDASPHCGTVWTASTSMVSPYQDTKSWFDYYLGEEGNAVVCDMTWDDVYTELTGNGFEVDAGNLPEVLDVFASEQAKRGTLEKVRFSHDKSKSLFSLDLVFRVGSSCALRSQLNFALIIHGQNKLKIQQDTLELRQFQNAVVETGAAI